MVFFLCTFVLIMIIISAYCNTVTQEFYDRFNEAGDCYFNHYSEWLQEHKTMPLCGPDIGFFVFFTSLEIEIMVIVISMMIILTIKAIKKVRRLYKTLHSKE